MRTFAAFLKVIVVIAILMELGCGRSTSKLSDIFGTDSLVQASGLSQGAVIAGKVENITVHPDREINYYADYDVKLSSGSYEQYLMNYQAAIVKSLQQHGVSVTAYEPPPAGFGAEQGVFRYLYKWAGGDGVVRVVWGTYATNHYAMIVIFTERRN